MSFFGASTFMWHVMKFISLVCSEHLSLNVVLHEMKKTKRKIDIQRQFLKIMKKLIWALARFCLKYLHFSSTSRAFRGMHSWNFKVCKSVVTYAPASTLMKVEKTLTIHIFQGNFQEMSFLSKSYYTINFLSLWFTIPFHLLTVITSNIFPVLSSFQF